MSPIPFHDLSGTPILASIFLAASLQGNDSPSHQILGISHPFWWIALVCLWCYTICISPSPQNPTKKTQNIQLSKVSSAFSRCRRALNPSGAQGSKDGTTSLAKIDKRVSFGRKKNNMCDSPNVLLKLETYICFVLIYEYGLTWDAPRNASVLKKKTFEKTLYPGHKTFF